jgi:hypothetical protein
MRAFTTGRAVARLVSCLGVEVKEAASFSEEKEAKRLLFPVAVKQRVQF